MLNHSYTGTAQYFYSDDKKGFCLVNTSDMPENVEIFDNYGRKSNADMYNNYGFFLPDINSKSAFFRLAIDQEDKFIT